MKKPSLKRLGSLSLMTVALGAPAILFTARLIANADGASLDPGETVMWYEPFDENTRIWQGPFVVEGHDDEGRLRIRRGETVASVYADEIEPLNRWSN